MLFRSSSACRLGIKSTLPCCPSPPVSPILLNGTRPASQFGLRPRLGPPAWLTHDVRRASFVEPSRKANHGPRVVRALAALCREPLFSPHMGVVVAAAVAGPEYMDMARPGRYTIDSALPLSTLSRSTPAMPIIHAARPSRGARQASAILT